MGEAEPRRSDYAGFPPWSSSPVLSACARALTFPRKVRGAGVQKPPLSNKPAVPASSHLEIPKRKNLMNATLLSSTGKITREEHALVPTPLATNTHRPIPHHEIVQALVETLGFRHIGVVRDEYAVSTDGMKVFGVLDLATEMH